MTGELSSGINSRLTAERLQITNTISKVLQNSEKTKFFKRNPLNFQCKV